MDYFFWGIGKKMKRTQTRIRDSDKRGFLFNIRTIILLRLLYHLTRPTIHSLTLRTLKVFMMV